MSSNNLGQADEDLVTCYMNEIPAFVETELSDLYETLHSSLPFFKLFRSIENVSCYVARRNVDSSSILLFKSSNRQLMVLNEMIEVDQSELQRFASYIFGRFEKIDVISFNAVKTPIHDLGFPVQRNRSKETYVIPLPKTPEEYTASIGKSTRADIRQKMNKVPRDFPSYNSKFFINEEIDEKDIRQIIRFSEDNIKIQDLTFSHDIDRIIAMSKQCGFVNVLSINGRVCAGSINYRVGSSYFGDVTGYDPQYEKYGLGKLCVHHTICESILRGGKRFYLGGGVFDFKSRLMGISLGMDELHIYRSRVKMLANVDLFIKAWISGFIARLKRTLQQHKSRTWARFCFKAFNFFKARHQSNSAKERK